MESATLKRAEATAGRMPDTTALKVAAHDETGEWEGMTVLSRFGEVPVDLSEALGG
jgi:hypothetical protein